jgi:hypothetical protein
VKDTKHANGFWQMGVWRWELADEVEISAFSLWPFQKVDAAHFPAHTRRMAREPGVNQPPERQDSKLDLTIP